MSIFLAGQDMGLEAWSVKVEERLQRLEKWTDRDRAEVARYTETNRRLHARIQELEQQLEQANSLLEDFKSHLRERPVEVED